MLDASQSILFVYDASTNYLKKSYETSYAFQSAQFACDVSILDKKKYSFVYDAFSQNKNKAYKS